MLKFSIGNLKIGKDTLIINMGSAHDCPSFAKGLCKIPKCYGKKSEKLYPTSLPFRREQERIWLNTDAITFAEEIHKIVSANRRVPIKYVRWNESSDFHSQECIDKIIAIAKMIPSIVFYCYTHRSDLITDDTVNYLPRNLVITTSNFRRRGLNEFRAIPSVKVHKLADFPKVASKIKEETEYACYGDCRKCGYCKKRHGKVIGVPMH